MGNSSSTEANLPFRGDAYYARGYHGNGVPVGMPANTGAAGQTLAGTGKLSTATPHPYGPAAYAQPYGGVSDKVEADFKTAYAKAKPGTRVNPPPTFVQTGDALRHQPAGSYRESSEAIAGRTAGLAPGATYATSTPFGFPPSQAVHNPVAPPTAGYSPLNYTVAPATSGYDLAPAAAYPSAALPSAYPAYPAY